MTNRWRYSQAFILIAALLAGFITGCGDSDCDRAKSVKIALPAAEDDKDIGCAEITFMWGGAVLREKATESGNEYYELLLTPGSLLSVGKDHGGFYVFKGDEEEPLVFSQAGAITSLNGRPVLIDMREEDASDVLAKMKPAEIANISSIHLSGDPQRDLPALKALEDSGVLVVLPDKRPEDENQEQDSERIPDGYVEAILASKPIGLWDVSDTPRGKRLLHEAKGLKYFAGDGADGNTCPELEFLGFGPRTSVEADVGMLNGFKKLRFLMVSEPSVADLEGLRELPSLECVQIESKQLRDLSPFVGLKKFRSLSLMDCEQLVDISDVPKLRGLKYLMLGPSKQIKDLSPLGECKGLKALVVGNDDLKERKAEYDELRKQLPDTEIVGFCMGSIWLVAVLAAGLGGGFLVRRLTGGVRAA